jgi:hypothetical protein
MCRSKVLVLLLGCLAMLGLPSLSFAGLTTFSDAGSFASQGTIAQNYGFEDVTPDLSGFYFAPDPWTTHGVTYTSGDNLVVAPISSYKPLSNVLCYNQWTPMTADIDPTAQYTLGGFDLSYLGSVSLQSFEVYTNLGTYYFLNNSVPIASQGSKFFGAATDSGEYFTGLKVYSDYGSGSAPALDNFRLGYKGNVVPEPASLSLLGMGLSGLFLKRRKKIA